MATRLLTLDTLAERPTVCIDKTDYTLKTAEDFGLADLARIQRAQNDLAGLMDRDDLTDAEIDRLAGVLDDLTALVLPEMPVEVRDRLRDGQKLAIIRAFREATEASQTPAAPVAAEPADWGALIPRLQRFYGGDLDGWLRTPLRWLRAYQTMYGPLQAEEALLGAEIAMAADSNIDHRKRQKVLDGWRRQANALTLKAKPKRERMSRDEFERMMATLGMVSRG